PRSQTPFGNARPRNSVSAAPRRAVVPQPETPRCAPRSCRCGETEFRSPAFPNGVWERGEQGEEEFKSECPKICFCVSCFEFDFVSDFEIRISDFKHCICAACLRPSRDGREGAKNRTLFTGGIFPERVKWELAPARCPASLSGDNFTI